MATAYVSFGGNVGDVAATFNHAAELLGRYGEVVRLSSLYSTPAVGENAGEPFLNAVAEVEAFTTPQDLLAGLHEIESELGRDRSIHWGPRTLDLDLLLYEDHVAETETLTVPHPRCWYRKFVLDGLAEIAGKVIHPVKGVSISQLKRQIGRRPFELGVSSADSPTGSRIVDYVNSHFMDADAIAWQSGDDLPNLIVWHSDSAMPFDDLPLVPRLDLTMEHGSPTDAVRDVLMSVGFAESL